MAVGITLIALVALACGIGLGSSLGLVPLLWISLGMLVVGLLAYLRFRNRNYTSSRSWLLDIDIPALACIALDFLLAVIFASKWLTYIAYHWEAITNFIENN